MPPPMNQDPQQPDFDAPDAEDPGLAETGVDAEDPGLVDPEVDAEDPGLADPEVGPGQGLTPERILALDVGNRRVGVAISDPLGILGQPLLTLFRKNPHADVKSIGRLIRRYSITDLVVGDPVHFSGELSAQARKTREFADEIQREHPEVRLHLMDERLTTAEAHTLLDRSSRRVRTRADRVHRERTIDQIAAVLLLDAFLSHRAPRLLPPPPDL